MKGEEDNDMNYEPPAWHKQVLDERRRRVAAGEAKFMPLEEFERSMREEIAKEKKKEKIMDRSAVKKMTLAEFKEGSMAATVGDLVDYLQKKFKPTDKLCYWFEGGAYVVCDYVKKSMLGGMMFKYVKDDKKRRVDQFGDNAKKVDEDFEYVGDDDVIIY